MAKNLVIVESPAKAKTIEKFLGKEFKVESSFGHIADLPSKELGVDVDGDFKPKYEVSKDKKPVVKKLRDLAKKAETVWLASDEDREGEAIAWHLAETLKLDKAKTKRIVFHEITKTAIEKENLGKSNYTDFLAISFSSTDYVGHQFGVDSKEIQDTYLRLDKDIERLLTTLDEKVGQDNYTVFLTADHGAIDVPAYLQTLKIPAGYLNNNQRKKDFQKFLNDTYGTTDIVENIFIL